MEVMVADMTQILAETGRGLVLIGNKSTIPSQIVLRPIAMESGHPALPDEAWLSWNPYPNHTI